MTALVKLIPPVAIDLVNKTLASLTTTSSVETAPRETKMVTGSSFLISARASAADSVSKASTANPASLTIFRYLLITRFGAAIKRISIGAELSVGRKITLYCKLTSLTGRGIYCSASQLIAAANSLSVKLGI